MSGLKIESLRESDSGQESDGKPEAADRNQEVEGT